MHRYDEIVVGAGLMGCFTARHLARRGHRVAVLERKAATGAGISRLTNAIVYAGYDMKPGTLKAGLAVECNAAFDTLCRDLGVAFARPGSLMIAFGPRGCEALEAKREQGLQNDVPGLQLLDAAEVQAKEPHISPAVVAALYSPTTGTVNPYQLCLAAARDAQHAGAAFFFEHEVAELASGFYLRCSNGAEFEAPVVVNCTGVAASTVSELVAPVRFRLSLSGASFLELGESASSFVNHVVFSEPEIKGKGATLVPAVEGTLVLGPSHDKLKEGDGGVAVSGYPSADYTPTEEGLSFVRSSCLEVFPELPVSQTLSSFGVLRPNINTAWTRDDGSVESGAKSIHDFYLAWADGCPGLLNIAGIKTPGVTCADGIGNHVANMIEIVKYS